MKFDLAVVGAGPAGASAAIEAAQLGLSVALVDENRQAGGQVWRAKSPAIVQAPQTPEQWMGDNLRNTLAKESVVSFFKHRVWQIEPSWRLATVGPDGPITITAAALVLATGAQERVLPVPGWTTPGAIGLAAATALLKEQMVLPGEKVVVAGAGPLLFFVANEILRNGGKVAAVVDLNGATDWIGHLPALVSRPDLLWRGAIWIAKLKAAGIPILHRQGIRRIEGHDAVERVQIGPVDRRWAPTRGRLRAVQTDSVCIGHGLKPSTDATQLLGTTHHYTSELGGWHVVTDPSGRTSVDNLYACGDGAGVRGSAAAPLTGRLAAIAAARDLGRLAAADAGRRSASINRSLTSATKFGAAMTALTAIRDGVLESIEPYTLVCRCEGVTRRDLEGEVLAGSISPNAVKSVTRCGMGPCGGRFCADSSAMLTAYVAGLPIEDVGCATSRPPLRPVPLDTLTGDFDYDDVPIPPAAPL